MNSQSHFAIAINRAWNDSWIKLMTFEIHLSPESIKFLKSLPAFNRKTIQAEIQRHLTHQPTQVSKSRIKELTPPSISQFRLRIGEYRVYYNVRLDDFVVSVLDIVEKGSGLTPEE